MTGKKERSPICIECGERPTYGLSRYCKRCLSEQYSPEEDDFAEYNRNEYLDYEDE